jgi:hypothetical protein
MPPADRFKRDMSFIMRKQAWTILCFARKSDCHPSSVWFMLSVPQLLPVLDQFDKTGEGNRFEIPLAKSFRMIILHALDLGISVTFQNTS